MKAIAEKPDFDTRSHRPNQRLEVGWQYFYENEVLLQHYSQEEIKYTLILLREGGLLAGNIQYGHKGSITHFPILGLTWEGQMLLKNIMSDTVWDKVKTKLKGLSNVSLPIIAECAGAVSGALVSSLLK